MTKTTERYITDNLSVIKYGWIELYVYLNPNIVRIPKTTEQIIKRFFELHDMESFSIYSLHREIAQREPSDFVPDDMEQHFDKLNEVLDRCISDGCLYSYKNSYGITMYTRFKWNCK